MTQNDFRNSEARRGLYLILPAVFLVILVVILPIISGIQISFTSQRVVGSEFETVGLKNYLDLFGGWHWNFFITNFLFNFKS